MTWDELATIQCFAARWLTEAEEPRLWRAACGRAYYAAYSAITSRLAGGTRFAHGRQNPAHEALPGHVDQLPGLSQVGRRSVRRALRRLRARREDADYRPGVTVDRRSALESLRDVAEVFLALGKE